MTNREALQAMSDEDFAKYLFYRGNGCEYCYGICAYQDECDWCRETEFCVSEIVKWLNQESEGEYLP